MSKPFDAILKTLFEGSPTSWPELFEFPTGAVTVLDADTSTVSGSADKVLRVSGPPDWILSSCKFDEGWPGLRYSEAPDVARAGVSKYLNPGHTAIAVLFATTDTAR